MLGQFGFGHSDSPELFVVLSGDDNGIVTEQISAARLF
jgi:hypothetical protein